MQRHTSKRLTWALLMALVLTNGWFAYVGLVPAQAHALCQAACDRASLMPARGNAQQPPPTASPTVPPPTQPNGGPPCLAVQVGNAISGCLANGSASLTATSLSQVTISGQNWMPGQGSLVICPSTLNGTCPNPPFQASPTVKGNGTFAQSFANLSFTSYTIIFSDGTKNEQHATLTITFTQGVSLALYTALGVAVLSLLVFLVSGGLRVASRQPVSQSVQQ